MTRAYRMFWTVTGNPPGGIHVTADVPADRRETLDGMHGPRVGAAGIS